MRLVSFTRYEPSEVGIEAELSEDHVMVTAFDGDTIHPIPLTADEAEQLAAELQTLAAELHAREFGDTDHQPSDSGSEPRPVELPQGFADHFGLKGNYEVRDGGEHLAKRDDRVSGV